MDLCLEFGEPDIDKLLDTPPFHNEFMLDCWIKKMEKKREEHSMTDYYLMSLIATIRRLRYVGDNPKAEPEQQRVKLEVRKPVQPKLMSADEWTKMAAAGWLSALGTTKEDAIKNAKRSGTRKDAG